MKAEEFPTTRVDWRLRAQALLKSLDDIGPSLAEEYLADVLEQMYENGGGGWCIHGDTCAECVP